MSNVSAESERLRKIWSGFQSSRVLLTANNYRIFDHLGKGKTSGALARDLGTDKRATEILLDALTGLGLLRKKGNSYKNADIASRLLVAGKPYYQGDIIRHADILWQNWSMLDEVLRKGSPCSKSRNHNAFILGMHNLAVLKAKGVVRSIGLDGVKKALDLGSGPGTYAIEMAKKGILVTIFDTPETIEIAKKNISKIPLNPPLPKEDLINPALEKGGRGGFKRNFQKNINFLQGDFLADDFGKGYDLILISQILHAYSEEDNVKLLKKSAKALGNNGRIAVQEFFIKENRAHPSRSSLFSVNMLVNTSDGKCYSPQEIKGWCLKAGLKRIRKAFMADSILIIAGK